MSCHTNTHKHSYTDKWPPKASLSLQQRKQKARSESEHDSDEIHCNRTRKFSLHSTENTRSRQSLVLVSLSNFGSTRFLFGVEYTNVYPSIVRGGMSQTDPPLNPLVVHDFHVYSVFLDGLVRFRSFFLLPSSPRSSHYLSFLALSLSLGSHFHIIVRIYPRRELYILSWVFNERRKKYVGRRKTVAEEKSVRLYNITSWKMLCRFSSMVAQSSHYPLFVGCSRSFMCVLCIGKSSYKCLYVATLGIGLDTEIFYCSHCRLTVVVLLLRLLSRSIF